MPGSRGLRLVVAGAVAVLALAPGTMAAEPVLDPPESPGSVAPPIPSAPIGDVPPVATPSIAPATVSVVVDIVPGLCPNHLRIDSPLTIPVGILGTEDLEVGAVEPSTIRLSRDGWREQIAPLTHAYKDVGSPLIGGRCACHELPGDGLDDLVLYFDIKTLAAALGLEGQVGETVPLRLSGKMVTGESISGVDCALVIDAAWADQQLERDIGFLADATAQEGDGRFIFAYFTDISDRLTFSIYDPQGRVVTRLADMDMAPGIYHAVWNATGSDAQRVPAGTYFARVSNSRRGETRKIEVTINPPQE